MVTDGTNVYVSEGNTIVSIPVVSPSHPTLSGPSDLVASAVFYAANLAVDPVVSRAGFIGAIFYE